MRTSTAHENMPPLTRLERLRGRVDERVRRCVHCGGAGQYQDGPYMFVCLHCADWRTALRELDAALRELKGGAQ